MNEEKKELVPVSQDVLARLRDNTGESSQSDFPFVPIYQVDNSSEKKNVEGRDVDILCAPRWKITTKDGEEYKTSTIEKFGGVLLKIMWQVSNNGKWDDNLKRLVPNGAPVFRSSLFNPTVLFGKKLLTIKFEDNSLESLTYPELKEKYGKENFKLVGWAFVLHNGNLIRLKMTGSSRSPLFDYPKIFGKDDSYSAHGTVFSAEYEEKPRPHNVAKFELAKESPEIDFNVVLEMQETLNAMFDNKANKLAEEFGGEVVEEVEAEEIKVQDVKFD